MKRKRSPDEIDQNPRPRKKMVINISSSDEDKDTPKKIRKKPVTNRKYPKKPLSLGEDIVTPMLSAIVDQRPTSNMVVPPPPSNPRKKKRKSSSETFKKRRNLQIPEHSKKKLRDFKSRANGKYERDEIVVYIDSEVLKGKGQKKLLETMKKEFENVEVVSDNPILSSIVYARKLPQDYMEASQEDFEDSSNDEEDSNYKLVPAKEKLLIRIPAQIFVRLIREGYLDLYLNAVEKKTEKDNTMVILVVDSLFSYLTSQENRVFRNNMNGNNKDQKKKKKKKKKSAPYVSPEVAKRVKLKIEQERERFKVFITSSVDETIRCIVQITKRVAHLFYDKPMELNLNSRYRDTIKRKAKNTNTAWKGFLQEIPGVSNPIANCIVKNYPKPKPLIDKYRSRGYEQKEKEERIADLNYTQNNKKKKIGKAISKKVYKVFTERDGNKRLND